MKNIAHSRCTIAHQKTMIYYHFPTTISCIKSSWLDKSYYEQILIQANVITSKSYHEQILIDKYFYEQILIQANVITSKSYYEQIWTDKSYYDHILSQKRTILLILKITNISTNPSSILSGFENSLQASPPLFVDSIRNLEAITRESTDEPCVGQTSWDAHHTTAVEELGHLSVNPCSGV